MGGQEKEWMRCFLDDLAQSFRHQRRPVDDRSPGRGEWRRTAEQGAERFMAKWIAVICPNVTGKTKERISPSKQARAGSLVIVD